VARGQNGHVDSLATLVSSLTKEVPRLIKVELVAEPSISARIDVAVMGTSEPCWMDLTVDFLAEELVPDDKKEANRMHRVAPQYWLSADRRLYWSFFGGSYVLCLRPNMLMSS